MKSWFATLTVSGSSQQTRQILQRIFRQRLRNETDNKRVINNALDILFVIRTRQNRNLALRFDDFGELLKFIKENKPVDNRHIDVQKNQIGQIALICLMFYEKVERTFARIFHDYIARKFGDFDDFLVDEIVRVIVINEHYFFYDFNHSAKYF
jgi:hypothetical protein